MIHIYYSLAIGIVIYLSFFYNRKSLKKKEMFLNEALGSTISDYEKELSFLRKKHKEIVDELTEKLKTLADENKNLKSKHVRKRCSKCQTFLKKSDKGGVCEKCKS